MSVFTNAATITNAARQAPTGHKWLDRLKALPSMVRAVLSGRSHAGSRFGVLLSLAGLLYVLSPLDLIPEILLGPFGIGDDIGIALAAVIYLTRTVDTFLDEAMTAWVEDPEVEVIQGTVLNRSE